MEKEKVLKVWKQYFLELLKRDKDSPTQVRSEGDCVYQNFQPEIEEPTLEEVEKAIREMKNNKAP